MKYISYDNIEFLMEWTCPYNKCGYLNRECGDCGEEETLTCRKCKKEVKVKEPS